MMTKKVASISGVTPHLPPLLWRISGYGPDSAGWCSSLFDYAEPPLEHVQWKALSGIEQVAHCEPEESKTSLAD